MIRRLKHEHDAPRCPASAPHWMHVIVRGKYTGDKYTCHRTAKAARAAANKHCPPRGNTYAVTVGTAGIPKIVCTPRRSYRVK